MPAPGDATVVLRYMEDADVAADLLGDAVETAEAQGKKKATAKHVKAAEPKKPAPHEELTNLRQELKALVAEAETREGKESGKVAIVFNPEQYDRFRALLGI